MNTPEQTAQVAIVDISGFNTKQKSNDGIIVEMKDPISGENIGFSVRVCGQDADMHKKRLAYLRNQNQFELRKNSKYIKQSEVIEQESIETIAMMIKGWTPFQYGGRVWVFSPAVAQEFVTEFDEFREQIETVIYERKNFLTGNAKTSSSTQSMTLASA